MSSRLLEGTESRIFEQEILMPEYPLLAVKVTFTNDGIIEAYYLPSCGDEQFEECGLMIICRRYPGGIFKWYEQVR